MLQISTPLTERLNVRHPIVLAPMDIVSDAKLVKAVNAAGGFGVLGGGYGEEWWLEKEMNQLAGEPLAVGFITWSLAKQPKLLDLVLARKPKAVVLSFGDPAPFIGAIKASGALAICQVQNVAFAVDALNKGADVLVAQGSEGGGHGGSCSTFPLLPAIVDAVGGKVPVVAAGGIADGRGLAGALALGAAGVLVGTRFYASEEAAGHPAAKERIVALGCDDSERGIIFDISRRNVWPAPFTGRVLINDHLERWRGRERELMQHVDVESRRYELARDLGDFSTAAVIAGECAGLIHEIKTAAEIVDQMVRDAMKIIQDLQSCVVPGPRSTRDVPRVVSSN